MAQPWEMSRELRLEQFSFAYVRALAAMLGFEVQKYDPDIFGIDLNLTAKGSRGALSCPSFGMQVKAATGKKILHKDGIHYRLEIPHYDALREQHIAAPRILVVVLIPRDDHQWIRQDHEELALRKCGYWLSLRGWEASANVSNITVCVPWKNILSVDALDSLMTKVSRQEPL